MLTIAREIQLEIDAFLIIGGMVVILGVLIFGAFTGAALSWYYMRRHNQQPASYQVINFSALQEYRNPHVEPEGTRFRLVADVARQRGNSEVNALLN